MQRMLIFTKDLTKEQQHGYNKGNHSKAYRLCAGKSITVVLSLCNVNCRHPRRPRLARPPPWHPQSSLRR